MSKFIILLTAPAVLLTATAGMAREPSRSFTHAGVTYIYDTTLAADGSIVLTGQTLPKGAKFRLVVKHGQVAGEADHRAVRFPVSESRGAAAGAIITPVRVATSD